MASSTYKIPSMSVSRKAVNRKMLPVFDKISRTNKLTLSLGPIREFNEWLSRFGTKEERDIVYLTTMGVVEDMERRVKNLKELLKKEVFKKGA